jgi:predicted nucleic acid-binding protein
MAVFVVDASVALAWCFEDEATDWSEGLLRRLRSGDQVAVPAHWPTEVSNGMLMGVRRKRIQPGKPEILWDELALLPITVEAALSPNESKAALSLCDKHGLTVYDAAYLELAHRKQLPVATLDSDLRRAAVSEGIVLL